jgi:hypothetical protein
MPRPKGLPKTGGRKKGSKNKRTEELEKAAASGMTPLDYLLKVMRDKKQDVGIRVDCAKAAAPYVHARRAPEDKHGNTMPPILYITPDLEAEYFGSDGDSTGDGKVLQ